MIDRTSDDGVVGTERERELAQLVDGLFVSVHLFEMRMVGVHLVKQTFGSFVQECDVVLLK